MQLGLSESARVTTAEESRFRIAYPNSRPRVSRIIALDRESLSAMAALKDHPWNGARFFRYVQARPGSASLPELPVDATLEDVDGQQASLSEEIADADVVVMVTTAGSAPEAAEIIGNACFVRGKRATGMVLMAGDNGEQLSKTLKAMRPYAAMLVVSTGEDYIGEMLSALRA
jgi:hypothetical protein